MIIRMVNGEQVEAASEVVESVDYRGFKIEVHELSDLSSPRRFMPLILSEDGEVVRRIFVRSKRPYVSLEHFARRAVDHFRTTGDWPRKQGITLKAG